MQLYRNSLECKTDAAFERMLNYLHIDKANPAMLDENEIAPAPASLGFKNQNAPATLWSDMARVVAQDIHADASQRVTSQNVRTWVRERFDAPIIDKGLLKNPSDPANTWLLQPDSFAAEDIDAIAAASAEPLPTGTDYITAKNHFNNRVDFGCYTEKAWREKVQGASFALSAPMVDAKRRRIDFMTYGGHVAPLMTRAVAFVDEPMLYAWALDDDARWDAGQCLLRPARGNETGFDWESSIRVAELIIVKETPTTPMGLAAATYVTDAHWDDVRWDGKRPVRYWENEFSDLSAEREPTDIERAFGRC